MTSALCQIKIVDDIEGIWLSHHLLKQLDILPGKIMKITFGGKEHIVSIDIKPINPDLIILSSKVANELCIPFGGRIRLVFDKDRIRLGPVVGIMTTGYTGDNRLPFKARSHLFRQFASPKHLETSFVFVFTPNMVDWTNKTVNGGLYLSRDDSGQKRWVQLRFPLPDVVYERVPTRGIERSLPVQQALARFQGYNNISIFNQGFFDKWSIHKILSNSKSANIFVPETQGLSEYSLRAMLNRHRRVFLKPNAGSLGLGIFQLTLAGDNKIYCRFNANGRNHLHVFNSIYAILEKYFDTISIRHYLIQKGILLHEIESSPVDFRVHLNKDANEDWQCAAIGAKVAGSGCITTHVRTGGRFWDSDVVLEKLFGKSGSKVRRKMEDVSITIAKAVDNNTNGYIGELGLDMGIDINNHIWVFEVNSKPGRHIFSHKSLRKLGAVSAKHIINYASKLFLKG